MAAEQLRPVTGFPLPISATPPSHGIYFLHRPDLTAASEYSLDSDLAVIRIGASSRTGLFYGLQTLLQLLPPSILLSTPSDRHHMPHGLNPRLASLPMARSDA
jgi:hexosaminidase